MSMEHGLKLISRRHPERTWQFQPEDHPDLWALTRGRAGLSGLQQARTSDVLKMFVPRSIRADLPLKRGDEHMVKLPTSDSGDFEIFLHGVNKFLLNLEANLEPATADTPRMLAVSDYDAQLLTRNGSQAFYRNLEYQLGHMDVPVIFGQKVPTALGYFLHRVGQVPVALLDKRFTAIRERIQQKYNCPQTKMLSEFPAFSFTAQIYGETPATLVDPQYRPALAELQTQFDAMSRTERYEEYPNVVREVFNLS